MRATLFPIHRTLTMLLTSHALELDSLHRIISDPDRDDKAPSLQDCSHRQRIV